MEVVKMIVPVPGFPKDEPQKTKDLITFKNPGPGSWNTIDDTVMGGVSRSRMSMTPDATGVFSGELSLENGGGFTSVRTFVSDVDLSGYSGLEIRVKGDGRIYQLRLRTNREFDGVAYRARFATEDGTWTTVRIPFNTFEPTFRGRKVTGAPPLDASLIRQLGLLLSDAQEGDFRLELEWVRAYQQSTDPEA
jgi:monofunctional biosynthetic peptidoglycan transglycosylase